jgi:hypothetical protein
VGRDQKQEVVGCFDAVVNLFLIVNAEGNVFEVEPDGEPGGHQAIVQLGGKGFAIGASVGNEGGLKGWHGAVLRGRQGAAIRHYGKQPPTSPVNRWPSFSSDHDGSIPNQTELMLENHR